MMMTATEIRQHQNEKRKAAIDIYDEYTKLAITELINQYLKKGNQ